MRTRRGGGGAYDFSSGHFRSKPVSDIRAKPIDFPEGPFPNGK